MPHHYHYKTRSKDGQTMNQTPDITEPLKNLLHGLAAQGPLPLLPTLGAFARRPVSEQEFLEFVNSAEIDNPGLIELRLALAKWDTLINLGDENDDGGGTLPGTPERRVAVINILGLSDKAEKTLRKAFPVRVSAPTVISKEFVPWYEKARHQRRTMYWDHYQDYLTQEKQWSSSAITTIDQSTDAVVERLADPTREDIKRTKGLVVGYVQSGKTANFTGVIAKAIDAGYRLVIVMTGTIEILRAQTQRRIDMELMGVENVLAGQDPNDPEVSKGLDYQQDEAWVGGKFVSHGDDELNQPGVARIRRVTTHKHDYKSLPQGMSQLRYDRHDRTKPLNSKENLFHTDAYVVVIKKNVAPLSKLIRDLKPLRDTLNELPALIIDDESDVASVNTKNPKKSQERTKINEKITEILEIVPRAQYVGYTATPFANVFIDPDETARVDLFPSDFVLSLPRPDGYMGVQEFHDAGADWDNIERTFSTSNEKAYVREIAGDPEDAPDLYEKELQRALDSWVLTGAIKKYREAHAGRTYRHHTMLVHEHVRNQTHSDSADTIRAIWNRSRFTSGAGLHRLRELYYDDFGPVMSARAEGEAVPETFDALKPFITVAVSNMTNGGSDPVLIVNGDKDVQSQQESLDFDKGRVWRILIGGTKLSRGFTVEGLTISYFRRKAGAADTLMQAGRWFGFREGYSDLVRLFIRRDDDLDLYEAFEALLLDEEAFREELAMYSGVDEDGKPLVEPRQIPPLVSQHLPWLKPTARNKMFNAVVKVRGSRGTFHQLSSVPERPSTAKTSRRKELFEQHRSNLENVVLPILEHATTSVSLTYMDDDRSTRFKPARVGLISAVEFLQLLDQHYWHTDFRRVIDPLMAFIRGATQDGRINDWAVVWPQRAGQGRGLDFPELSVSAPIFRRNRRPAPRIDFTGESKRNIRSAEGIASGEPIPGVGASKKRGVIVISLVADRAESSESQPVSREEVVGLISLRVPDSSAEGKDGRIQYGVVIPEKASDVAVDIKQ